MLPKSCDMRDPGCLLLCRSNDALRLRQHRRCFVATLSRWMPVKSDRLAELLAQTRAKTSYLLKKRRSSATKGPRSVKIVCASFVRFDSSDRFVPMFGTEAHKRGMGGSAADDDGTSLFVSSAGVEVVTVS